MILGGDLYIHLPGEEAEALARARGRAGLVTRLLVYELSFLLTTPPILPSLQLHH